MQSALRLLAVLSILTLLPLQAAATDFATKSNEDIAAPTVKSSLPPGPTIGDVSFSCSTSKSGRCGLHDFMSDARICALLVIKDGSARLREFGDNLTNCLDEDDKTPSETSLLGLASITKSVVSVLTGHAIAKSTGARTRKDFERVLNRPIGQFVPELADSAYGDVSLKHVLSMRSGVRWKEHVWPFPDDAKKFRREVRGRPVKKKSIVEFAMNFKDKRARPGARFDYMALDPNVVGVALTGMLGGQLRLPEFFRRGVWRGIGANGRAKWGIDKVGGGIADCCVSMTLDDLGRFGLLVLRKGRDPWGEPLIPAAWFDISLGGFEYIPDKFSDQNPGCPMAYGYFWWQRDGRSDFTGVGINGQFLHIYPEENAVVVQISDWKSWDNELECDSFRLHDALVQDD